MSKDLLDVVEESKVKGYVSGAINSTFITLMPKMKYHVTFQDF